MPVDEALSLRRRLVGASAGMVIVAMTQTAAAQPATATGDKQGVEERRTILYRAGVDAATAGRWAEARDDFAAAVGIRASPKVLFSLAQAEEQLGRLASACADYAQALDGAKAAGESDVVSAAEQALDAALPRVPHIRVVVTDGTTATATLDGVAMGVGSPVAVDPGTHAVAVSAPGRLPFSVAVVVSQGQQLDVPVRLEIAGTVASAPVPPPSTTAAPNAEGPASDAWPWRTIGLVTAGAGVAALGVGAAFGLEAKSKNDQSNTSGCHGDSCTASAAQVRRDALWAANASTVAFVIGGVLTAGGLVLWLVPPSPPRQRDGVGVTAVPFGSVGGGLLMTAGWP